MAANILKLIPGEKRNYAFQLSGQQEIVNGETLSGTPAVTINDGTAITIFATSGGSGANQGQISGTQVTFWITSTTAALTGDRYVTVTVSTSGGAIIEDVGTLRIVAQ